MKTLILLAAIFLPGCAASTAVPIINGVLDISDAICDMLEPNMQNEPGWVKFTCSLVDPATNVISHFTVKVDESKAGSFALQHCPKDEIQ